MLAVACGSAEKHVERGTRYVEQKKYPEAIVELRTALQMDPQQGEFASSLLRPISRTTNPATLCVNTSAPRTSYPTTPPSRSKRATCCLPRAGSMTHAAAR
jgi:hypothetical protein